MKKAEWIEHVLGQMFAASGIDIPRNLEPLVLWIENDIIESGADNTSEDIRIAYHRWLDIMLDLQNQMNQQHSPVKHIRYDSPRS